MTADFLRAFFNLFDCRFVFAPSFFLFSKCVTKARLALSHIQLNLALRTPHYYGQFALSFKPLYGHVL